MRSFDLFDTLVCARNGGPAGDNLDQLFVVAQNFSQIKPQDLIVSDYYNPQAAQEVVKQLGLKNELIVTAQDKANGKIWPHLKARGVTEHIGDNQHSDFNMPNQAGIRGIHFRESGLTPLEKNLYVNIDPNLGLISREARLTSSFNNNKLAELQFMVNWPFLLLATVSLEREMMATATKHALLSSRDGNLWVELANHFFTNRNQGMTAEYFFSGRLPRVYPSANYLKYVNGLLNSKPCLLVDLNGTGWSLKRLVERTDKPETPLCLVSYVKVPGQEQLQEKMAPSKGTFRFFVEGNPVGFEVANYAQHPMVTDVDEAGAPVYFNPTGYPWAKSAQIADMQTAFMHMMRLCVYYDWHHVFELDHSMLQRSAQMLLQTYHEFRNEFQWQTSLFQAEHAFIFRELARKKAEYEGS
jgi:hypothetical protein